MTGQSSTQALRRAHADGFLRACVAVAVALTALLWAGTAAAHASEKPSYETPEDCIEAKPIEVDPMAWSCFSPDGETWVSTQRGSPAEQAFTGFVVLALLWSGVPLAIAAVMASARDESIGTAIVLTALLGWIGLAIVYLGQRKSRAAVEGLMERSAGGEPGTSRSTARVRPVGGEPAATPRESSAADRLRELSRLHREQLITDDEYQQQRQRLLDQL